MNNKYRTLWRAIALTAAIGLAGCTVGPDFKSPQPDVPAHWHSLKADVSQASTLTSKAAQLAHWWRVFNDPTLTHLVRQALHANLSLKQAKQRIREARAQLAVVTGQAYPTLGANASYTRQRASAHGASAAAAPDIPGVSQSPSDLDLFEAGFDATWELDLFGGKRRQAEAARARLAATIEKRRGVRVSLAAEVARNYIALRGYQHRLHVARNALDTQQSTLELMQNKYQAGLSSLMAVQRAQARVARTRASIPSLETGARQAIHRLSVLLAQAPGALMKKLSVPKALPQVPARIPVGLPSTLVRRRPDIRRAERQLHAATADIGVAVSRLFPQFSITGQFGFKSTGFDQLTSWGSRFFGIGPSLTIPIFRGGQLRARVRIQKAQRKQALLHYRQTVLTALREVEDAIVAYRNVQQRRDALTQTVQTNRKALNMARDLYRSGLTGYLDVLDAQRALLKSEKALAKSVQSVRTHLVALYKALGGGWSLPQGKDDTAEHQAT